MDQPLADIVTTDKGTQLTDESTFMSVSNRQLMKFDMRSAGGAVAGLASPPVVTWAAGSDYKSKNEFTCLATTGDGHVAVGDKDGVVRLFTDKTLTRAKTTFPGFGAPVTHIDVSYDGHWVLATCDGYVLVICTLCKDARGVAKTGFEAQARQTLGLARGPRPGAGRVGAASLSAPCPIS